MQWFFQRATIDPATERYQLRFDGPAASFDAALSALASDDASLRDLLLATLRQCPFDAFFWETPPIAATTLSRPFELVLIDAPTLGRGPPDEDAFREHFDAAPDAAAVAFPSLRGDACLIAPTPRSGAADYGHLAAFVRTAPEAQQHDLLRLVARCARERVGAARTWLSTSGLAVAWLHVRLDTSPKYYAFAEFRTEGASAR